MPVHPRAHRRLWWLLFVAFAALFGAWSLSTPLFSGTDESAHAIRAAAAARGEFVGHAVLRLGWHMDYRVPEAYAKTNDAGCFKPDAALFARHGTATSDTPVCQPSFSGTDRLVTVGSYEFRGLPAYYSVVGLPTRLVPDGDGVYLMRLLSAAACAALAASALASTLRRRHRLPMVLGALLAFTPEVVYLAGLVNPNGLEVVASITLFATLLALAHDSDEDDGRLVLRAGVALVVLVAMRSIDPLVGALALATFALLAGGRRARAVWQRTDARRWLAVAAGIVVLHGVWVVTVALGYGEERRGHGLAWAVGRWDDVLRESVGVFGSSDIRLPAAVYLIWGVAAVALIGLGVVVGSARHRAIVAVLLGLAALFSVGVDGFNLPPLGFDWQGRYGLPLVVGAVLVALDGVRPDALGPAWRRRAPAAAAVTIAALLAAQVIAFVGTARRLGLGPASSASPLSYVFGSTWEPALPPVVLLALFGAGIVLLGALTTAPTGARPRRAATVPG